jgi:F0F1-type ATP synthase assembly protein I
VQQYWKHFGDYGTVGLEVVLSVLAGLLGGRWLDKKFHTDPWFAFLGLAIGIAAAVRALYRTAARAKRDAVSEELKQRQERKRFHERDDD